MPRVVTVRWVGNVGVFVVAVAIVHPRDAAGVLVGFQCPQDRGEPVRSRFCTLVRPELGPGRNLPTFVGRSDQRRQVAGVKGETHGQVVLVSEEDPLAFLGMKPRQEVPGLGGCIGIHRGNGRAAGVRFGNAGGATRRCEADER